MEIWSCKSSTHDESKISIYMSHMSHMSQALSRLTFLRDMCLMPHAAHVPGDIYAKCATHEKHNTHATHVAHVVGLTPPRFFARHVSRAHVAHVARVLFINMCPHVSQAMSRLTFLGDTCLKSRAACVPCGICVTHEKRKTCARCATCAISLAPLSFFVSHICKVTRDMCETHTARPGFVIPYETTVAGVIQMVASPLCLVYTGLTIAILFSL